MIESLVFKDLDNPIAKIAALVELVDTTDLKSVGLKLPSRFDSGRRHHESFPFDISRFLRLEHLYRPVGDGFVF